MDSPRYKNTLHFYRAKFRSKLAKFNVPSQLPDYFGPMISDKKEVTIAELAAGPICTIGNSWKDIKVNIHASDVLQNEYAPSWEKYGATPIVPVEYQDMEHLTYPDEFFDIVHCVNALDHTLDARQALREIIRICKTGGWIYLRHMPDQRKHLRGMHAWDINEVNGDSVFSNRKEKFLLSQFGNFKTHTEGNLIVSTLQKDRTGTKRLTELGIKHNTDKATYHLFTEIYDDFFQKFKNPSILEIGVGRGASLRLYDEYYDGKCNIVGLDNKIRRYDGNGNNIKVIIGDQSKIEDLKKCIDAIKEYDIVIDDGGHFVREQQISFSFLFDHIKSGGIYIIEDLHANFDARYNPEQTINTIDLLAQLDKGIYDIRSPYISQDEFDRLKRQIKSIEIFGDTSKRDAKNSITSVITKN